MFRFPAKRTFGATLSKRLKHTFENQETIQRLPIPSIENLKTKYLNSLKPLLGEGELLKTTEIVEEFLGNDGFGTVLNNRLIEHDKSEKDSWLEKFWLQKAYLEWREPSLINVNWWCEFINHPEQPKDLLVKIPPKGVISSFQVTRAAGLINGLLNFSDMLDEGTYPAETIRKTPLCMNQYKKIFGTTRIPGDKTDYLVHQYPTKAKHIIVMINNQMFKVDVKTDANERVPISEIERLLLATSKEALSTLEQPAIGLLTAGHRDTNYKGYETLKSISSKNAQNFEIIKDALFVVCLDDSSTKSKDLSHHRIFHGYNAENRWFDKCLQLIVANNGRAGINGEHSPCDAVVPGKVIDYIIENEPAVDPEFCVNKKLAYPQKLIWETNSSVLNLLEEARNTAVTLIKDTESCLLQTDIYGSRYMKEVAKASPDAYVQMALQLAYYRLHKEITPVYESASTRFFKHGRTETGRSMSVESLNFIKAFDDDNVSYDDKLSLFRTAVSTQSSYMKDAAFGKGIDRHMLGMRCMIKPDEMDKATMFTDPSYLKSMYFKLSTSNMSPGKNFYGGFGPVVPEGYGINYAIDHDDLKFSISSKVSCKGTNSFKFREMLELTLKDLLILFPKRTEVWGPRWKNKHDQEKKEAYQLAKMKAMSDKMKLSLAQKVPK